MLIEGEEKDAGSPIKSGMTISQLTGPFRRERPGEALYLGPALRLQGLNCRPSVGMPEPSPHRASEPPRFREL